MCEMEVSRAISDDDYVRLQGLEVQYTKRPDSKPRMARNLDRLILPLGAGYFLQGRILATGVLFVYTKWGGEGRRKKKIPFNPFFYSIFPLK